MKPASAILMMAWLALPALGQQCVVSGRVTNAVTGEPVGKAKLHLRPSSGEKAEAQADNEPARHAYFTWSDGDGSFEFTGIEAGSYDLSGDHLGFISTQYGSKKRGQMGATLLARAGHPITGLTFALVPGAVISGKVTDDNGDPVPEARVQIMMQTWESGKARYAGWWSENSADDRGEFRISGIEPGTYVLSAQMRRSFRGGTEMDGKPQTSFVTTFFPAVASAESATPIHLQPGQEISGLEIRLHAVPSFHIRGRIAGAGDGAKSGRLMLSIKSEANEGFGFRGFAQVKEDGTFDASGMAPGAYQLTATFLGKNGQMETVSSQPVMVTSQDINDVTLAPQPVISVHGLVRVTGTSPPGAKPWNPSRFHVTLVTADMYGKPAGTSASTKADGSFTVENVAQRVYRLETSGAPDGAYLQPVRFNGEAVPSQKLDLTRSTSGDLVLVFRYGAPELVVKAKTAAAQMNGGVRPPAPMLMLLPDPPHEDSSGVEERQADENGSFTFKELTPGSYRAFAFEELDWNALNNPAFLKAIAAKGTLLELKEGDRKQIEVPVITADEMAQILRKLGMNAE
jgi:protocatechuate 3,4-dioxygenase beta subunit